MDKSGLDVQDIFSLGGIDSDSFDVQQKRDFSDAAVACWLHTEAFNLAVASEYCTADTLSSNLDQIYSLWTGQFHKRALHQQLHILEVYDFIYGLLLCKVFAIDTEIESWTSANALGPRCQWSNMEQNWDTLVSKAQSRLRPLDIASLTLKGPPLSRMDKTRYMSSRGVFDRLGHGITGRQWLPLIACFVSVSYLEEGVERMLPRVPSGVPVNRDLYLDFENEGWRSFRQN